MAIFCLAFRMSPDQYRSLTLEEYLAFVQVYDKQGTTSNLEDLL